LTNGRIESAQSFSRDASAGRWLIAAAVLASAIMELVDTSAVNVSLPYIAGNLSASINESDGWRTTSGANGSS
jgi:hypothetical protein